MRGDKALRAFRKRYGVEAFRPLSRELFVSNVNRVSALGEDLAECRCALACIGEREVAHRT
jgi:hypothetical protein